MAGNREIETRFFAHISETPIASIPSRSASSCASRAVSSSSAERTTPSVARAASLDLPASQPLLAQLQPKLVIRSFWAWLSLIRRCHCSEDREEDDGGRYDSGGSA